MLDEVIVQSSRYSDIQKQIRKGIVNFDDANTTKNQIRFSILDLIREINEQVKDNPQILKEVENIGEAPKSMNKQIHYGYGDNIMGDKVINNK